MRIWLVGRLDTVIGAYWPIKGEFDPLPALHRWKEDGELIDQPQPRRIGLPVVDKVHKTMRFHAWYPGCPMEEDAYGIPKPKDTEVIVPTLLFVACVGYAPGGYRLGYGGGFYDRMLATLAPRPFTVGLGFANAYVPDFEPEAHDLPLDAILNDKGWSGQCDGRQWFPLPLAWHELHAYAKRLACYSAALWPAAVAAADTLFLGNPKP